jgi:hypothetical protein
VEVRADLEAEENVQRANGAVQTDEAAGCTDQLARFFPSVAPQHVAARVEAIRPGSTALRESTILEFGDEQHAIFLSTLPLEFADRVRVVHGERPRAAEALVVAVQYHEGRKAVAVRFSRAQDYWVKQP